MKYLLFTVVIAMFILAASCAKQTTPSGGPKDSIPPTLITSVPANGQTNFKMKTITLTFDEFVNVNNPREQIIITPSVGKNPQVIAKKKNIIMTLDADLQDSTTYTINFRESVQDLTEKNPAENLKLAFSTGSYIDSLSISGKVFDLQKGKELKNATVAIYHNADTFDIFTHKPQYFTQTNNEGEFALENLKPGAYYIYAFEDKNKNLLVDSKSELYGFKASPVTIQSGNDSTITINLVRLDARKLKLISARPSNTYFAIKPTKWLHQFDIQTVNKEDSILFTYSYEQNSINVYPVTMTSDSIPVRLQAKDSVNFSIDTLLYVKLPDRKVTPEKFNMAVAKPLIFTNSPEIISAVSFNKPIAFINTDSITFKIDSVTTVSFQPQDIQFINSNELMLTKKMDKELLSDKLPDEVEKTSELTADDLQKGASRGQAAGKLNQLIIGTGAFISIENDSTKRNEQKATIYKPEETSTISVAVQTNKKNFITQLVDGSSKVIQSSINQTSTSFTNLVPGEYQIRLIIDENANGTWDPGNFYKRKEPEKIVYYRSEEGLQSINIKANWELGPLLITYENNVENRP